MKREWLKRASRKGVLIQKRMRIEEDKKTLSNLSAMLNNEKNLSKLASICGFIMGDGCLEIRKEKNKPWFHHEIRFYPDNLDVAKLFVNYFEKLYGKTPTIKSLKNFFEVRVISRVACKHLSEIAQFSGLKWTPPKGLLINRSTKIEFIKAIFDCEGCVGKRNVQFQSVNKEGIHDIKRILEELGIESSIYEYTRKNLKWNKNYIMVISRKENIKKYAENIGFNHPKKRKKLEILAGVPERLRGQSRELVSVRMPRFES